MKRKLRKSLSWLLTVAMIFSLFCGMIPTASAAPDEQPEETYITADFYEGVSEDVTLNKVDLTIKVVNTEEDLLQTIPYGLVLKTGATEKITLNSAYYGIYELADIKSENGNISSWSGNFTSSLEQTFTYSCLSHDTDTITVVLKEAENTLALKSADGSIDMGVIAYKEGLQITNVEVYLNYQHVVTYKNVGIANVTRNFLLNLNNGYYYGDARNNMDYDSEIPGQTITYTIGSGGNTYDRLTYGVPSTSISYQDEENTIKLYFFNFEEGVNIDFDRTVNGITINNNEACPSMEISYTYAGTEHSFTYDTWDADHTIYVPKGTNIYVEPNIQDGYSFNYWYTSDGHTAGNTIYTIKPDGTLVEESLTSVVNGIYAVSEDMVFNCNAPGFESALIYLRMLSGDNGYYTVTYDANGGTGEMTPQTFDEYYVYIQENAFTAPEGKEFDSWNTASDGSGAEYTPGTVYGYESNEKHNLILYAQWKDSGTTPPDPSDEYDITGFTKTLVIDEKQAAEAGAKVPGSNRKVTIPVNAEVKLLYELKVTGKGGTNFTITEDKNVELVDSDAGYTLTETETGTTITGTIPTDKTEAVIYVTKSFVVGDISNGKLTNNASIAVTGEADGVDPAVVDETVETDAEEGAPIPPTSEEAKTAIGDNAVEIVCIGAEFNHEAKTYGLLEGGYEISQTVTGDGETEPWSVTITVTPNVYVDQYEIDREKEHTLVAGQPEKQYLNLEWTDDGWTLVSGTPQYMVTCDDGTIMNAIEYHVMYLQTIKEAVAEKENLDTTAGIGIYAIHINGTVDAVWPFTEDHAGRATGGVDGNRIYHVGDLGWIDLDPDTGHPANGYYPEHFISGENSDFWRIQNTIEVVNDDTITSITIYYKLNGVEKNVDIPRSDFTVKHFDGAGDELYTEIYLKNEPDPTTPTAPTVDELETLLNEKITVACTTTGSGHSSANYGWIAGGIDTTNAEVTAVGDGTYTYEVTVDADPYVTKYNENATETHTNPTFKDSKSTITLTWTPNGQGSGAWTAGSGVTINVTCDGGTVTPPEGPTDDDIAKLGLTAFVTDKNSPISHGSMDYPLAELEPSTTYYKIVKGTDENTYNVVLTVAEFAKHFEADKGLTVGTHTSNTTQGKAVFVLTWNSESGTWETNKTRVTISLNCTPKEPTIDVLDDLIQITVKDFASGNVPAGAIDHGNQIIGLLADTYEIGEITPDQDSMTYTAELTLKDGNPYAEKYDEILNRETDTHIVTSTVSKLDSITLTYNPATGKWTASDEGWTLGVACGVEIPEKPGDEEIPGIFSGKDAVHVICKSNRHDSAVFKELWANEDGKTRYSVSDPGLVDGVWTCTVTILPTVYVDQYSENNGTPHWLSPAGQTGAAITLKWDAEQSVWQAVDNGEKAWATFTVACVPEKPGDEEIPGIVDPDPNDDEVNALIQVKCVNEAVEHTLKTKDYELWANNANGDGITRYTVDGPKWDEASNTWTCTVTFKGETYVTRYNEEAELNGAVHGLVPGQADQTVVLTWNAETQTWTAPTALTNPIATFQVTCDPTVVGSYDLTFDANGGKIVKNGSAVDAYTENDLKVGKYTLSTYVSKTDLIYDGKGEKVIFAGWTTEPQNKQVYRYNDADIPEIVETVTIEDQPVTVWAVWGYDEDEDGVADINEVVITPADIIIYTGGSNYKGDIVDENGKELTGSDSYNGFPVPGFYITLPANLNQKLQDATDQTTVNLSNYLTFVYQAEDEAEKSWKLSLYNPGSDNGSVAYDKYVYRMDPAAEGQDPVRLLIQDEDGTAVPNDQFTIQLDELFKEYTMSIYSGDVQSDKVTASLTIGTETETVGIFIDTGKLTVRGVTDEHIISPIEAEITDAVKQITASGTGNTYFTNDSKIEVTDPGSVSLLVDPIVESDETAQILEGKIATALGIELTDDYVVSIQYLDLVDTSNGNAYVTMDQTQGNKLTIHWPKPSTGETFYVVHFDGLDRDFSNLSEELEKGDTEIEVYKQGKGLTTDEYGNLVFTTRTFSPFALVYETKDPGTGPDTDPDDNKDDDHYTGGGGNDNDSDPTGNLSIELDVNGGDDEFTFTVYFTDEDGDDLRNNFYYNGDYTGTIGSGDEITLEGGDKIVIRNLPEGTRYEVIIETADGYTYVIDGEEGIIRTGTNEAEFTATRTVPLADPSVTGVSRWLNVTDHIAYLTGYPGGAFGPNNSMTRAEVAQMFYALLNNKNVTITKTFPDVPANAWYATAVNTLASLGMVSGDANGNYRPNDPITRAEFCVIALAFAYEPDNAVCYFSDVSRSDWFYTYVAQAASYGWIGGYTNGNFGPNDRITRAQVTTIVNNMLGRAADRDYVIDHQADLVQFTDLNRTYWGYYQIMEATNAHDYTKSNGTENWR